MHSESPIEFVGHESVLYCSRDTVIFSLQYNGRVRKCITRPGISVLSPQVLAFSADWREDHTSYTVTVTQNYNPVAAYRALLIALALQSIDAPICAALVHMAFRFEVPDKETKRYIERELGSQLEAIMHTTPPRLADVITFLDTKKMNARSRINEEIEKGAISRSIELEIALSYPPPSKNKRRHMP